MTAARVLIVDDHAGVRRRIRELVAEARPDASFAEADTAASGLRFALDHDWELAIIDIQLPDRSGLEVVRQLAVARPLTPIIVVSALSPEAYAVEAHRAGAHEFIRKQDLAGLLAPSAVRLLEARS